MAESVARKGGLTRRGFLKATAAAAGAVGVAGAASIAAADGLRNLALADETAAASDTQVFNVCCSGNCGGLDTLQCSVRDGVGFNVSNCKLPERRRENICQRGMSNLYRIYGEHRLKYPLRRVGERGSGEFERISWDEAISEICEKWKGYQREFGNTSVVFCGGSGSQRADSNGESGYLFRLFNYMGASHMILSQDQIAMTSLSEMVGQGLTAWGNDWCTLDDAENIVCWGSNPTENAVVRYRHIAHAQKNGARFTVIDPNFTIAASKADEYIPICPASDGLVLIAMMRHIIENGLQHDEFLKEKTVAPFLVKDADGLYLRLSDIGRAQAGADDDLPLVTDASGAVGTVDEIADPLITGATEAAGVPVHTAYDLLVDRVMNSEWTDEQIEEWTEIPMETIHRLAEDFATKKTTCIIAYGQNHYTNGQTFYYNFIAMMMLTGNWAEPGRGIVGGDISFLFAAGPDVTALCNPEDAPGIGYTFYVNYLDRLLEEGHIGTDQPVTVKSLFIQAGNLVGNQADRQQMIRNLDKIEFVVCSDIEESDTINYCDIVLPVCHWWESWGYLGSEGYLRISEKALEPAYESKSDLEINNLLLEGMGFADKTMTTDEFFTRAFDNDTARSLGLTWERLKEEKVIPALPEGFVPCNGANDGFATETGRAQFYREGCRPNPDFGQEWDYQKERLPYWEPPTEAWFTTEAAQKYPLQFTTERAKFKVHSMFSFAPNLLEIAPEPVLYMGREAAEARGIETGDTVRVFNDRGYVVIKVAVNDGVRRDMVLMDHGWHDVQFIEGHYQDLTGHHTGMTHCNACYNDTMVEVEKVS